MIALSQAVSRIAPSPTIAITQKAREMRAAGRDVISLSAGEPNFPTPPHVAEAATRAIADDKTHYTAPDGIPELKAAIAAKLARENGIGVDLGRISVGAGAKQVIFNAFAATINPGDEVIVPAPGWVSYPDIARLFGGRAVPLVAEREAGWIPAPDALAAAITERTRWLVLNSPANPTGAVLSAGTIAALLDVVRAHERVLILADDIYEHLIYDGTFATPAAVAPDLGERILTVNGVSKAHAMTGWRIGWGSGPAPLVAAMRVVQSQTTSCPASVSQWAAVAALRGPQDHVKRYREAFRARRDRLIAALQTMTGLSGETPTGAFYAFPSCAGAIGRRTRGGRVIADDAALAEALLEEAGVAVVPGAAFGASPALRLSYAASDDDLDRAAERLADFFASLR